MKTTQAEEEVEGCSEFEEVVIDSLLTRPLLSALSVTN